MKEMVLSILTKQLDIEKENCLHKEEEQLLLGRKMAKKRSVCLEQRIFLFQCH